MADQFKIDDVGHCKSCGKVPAPGETVQCYACREIIYALCSEANTDNRVATKTMVSAFLLPSTKSNFMFYCDVCLTKFEISKADDDSKRVDILEGKIEGIDQQLGKIMELLTTSKAPYTPKVNNQSVPKLPKDNIWADARRLESIKAPQPKAALVISKDADLNKNKANHNVIEQIVMDNEIPLTNSHKNESGDIVLICENREARDTLKTLVQNTDSGITMTSPKAKLVPISIVGLPRNCSKEDAVKMFVMQNQFIKKFSAVNKIEEHINIHLIKPLNNKPDMFQIFASVSPVLRDGLRINKDKVVIGLSPCKVYDRKLVRRCNNCQHFGHFAKECPTSDEPKCGKCAENHRTDLCTSEVRKCVNCIRNNLLDTNHAAFYYKCPCVIKHQEDSLNSKKNPNNNPR